MPLKEKSLSGGEEKHEIGGQSGLQQERKRTIDNLGKLSRKQIKERHGGLPFPVFMLASPSFRLSKEGRKKGKEETSNRRYDL